MKTNQTCLTGFIMLLIVGAYSLMIQAEPEYHLLGRATAGSLSNYQLVEVGQIVGIIKAKVEVSFAEIFLDVGTGAVRGTIRRALKWDSSLCGTRTEDITFALTGTFSMTTKQFLATSLESRHYNPPKDDPELCKDRPPFPSFNFCGNLDDDKTISIYSVDGGGACTPLTRLEGRVFSDVPIELCSTATSTPAINENLVRPSKEEKCFEPPSIHTIAFPREWIIEKLTNVTVTFRNPGKHKTLTVILDLVERASTENPESVHFNVDVGGKEKGSFSFKRSCRALGPVDIRVALSNADGESDPFHDSFICHLARLDLPSFGDRPKLTKQQKDALIKTADAAEDQASLAMFITIFCLDQIDPLRGNICEQVFVSIAKYLIKQAAEKKKLANDPPDPNFTEIAQPVTPPFTPITTQDPTLQKLVDASNALLLNQAQTIGLEEALLHALERAQGAYEAQDAYWQFKQMAAAAQYSSQLATLLKGQIVLHTAIPKEWKAAGVPNIALSKDDVARLQSSVSTRGFPREILDVFAQLNIDNATINQLKEQLLAKPPQALAGNYPAKFNNPKLNSAIQAVASGFTQLASKGCKVNVSAELSFIRFDEDVTRYFAFLPDGKKDGHFQFKLTRPNASNLIYLKLETADTNNRPAFGQVWDTDLNTDWLLGIQDSKGKKINTLDKKISLPVNKTATLELFANDSGYFKSGQHFIVTALFKDGCVAQASAAIAPQLSLLKVDDGTYELSVGFPTGVPKAYFVNRLTPTSYPATLKNVQIHFTNRTDGLKQNDAFTLLVGTNPTGNTNLNNISFQQISAKVKALDQFNQYDTTAVKINSGDFIVGFWAKNPVNIFPIDEDTTAPSLRRSYITADGVNFSLVDSYANLAGNFAIRATVLLGDGAASGASDEWTLLTPTTIEATALEYHDGQLSITVLGASVSSIQLRLYDLKGVELVNQAVQGNTMTIPALTQRRTLLANGVYLYVLKVRTLEGAVIQTKLQKLVVIQSKLPTK